MSIYSIFDTIEDKYKPLTTKFNIYLDESIYCTIKFDNKDLRIGLNLKDNRIYIYFIGKPDITGPVDQVLSSIKEIKFNSRKNMVFVDLNNQVDVSVQIFIKIVEAFDHYVAVSQSKINKAIYGNDSDINNNIINAPENLSDCYVHFKGNNNLVCIHHEANLKNVSIEFLGNNGVVEIGKNVSLSGTLRLGYNCKIKIGNFVSSTNKTYMTCAENTKIEIGDDCMFATNNQIRTDDAHAIYDSKTGVRVNKSLDISIGNHVWIGHSATILGGSVIGNGSIVGMSSIVKKKFPNNCVIAGIPAKVVKKDVFWQRPNVLHFDENKGGEITNFKSLDYCNISEELT